MCWLGKGRRRRRGRERRGLDALLCDDGKRMTDGTFYVSMIILYPTTFVSFSSRRFGLWEWNTYEGALAIERASD
jgi:hypothetical protein